MPVVLTNSTFTANAIQEAQSVGVLLWDHNIIPIGRQAIKVHSTPKKIAYFLISFIISILLTIKLFHILGLFPVAFVVIIFLLYFWANSNNQQNTSKKESISSNKKQMSDQEALLYGMMCEKHIKERDYMEQLGIDPDDYENS